jgi:hypothetical protein
MASKVRPRASETSPIAATFNGGGEDVRVLSRAVRTVTVVCSANIVWLFWGNGRLKNGSGGICSAVVEEPCANRGAGAEIGRGTVAEICVGTGSLERGCATEGALVDGAGTTVEEVD